MNSKTIARNTAWYGLEQLIGFVTTLVTSIAIARTLGPAKMGYLIYVSWLTGIVSNLGSVGLPETTRKYMAEFIGGGDYATARFIYLRTFTIQTITGLTSGVSYSFKVAAYNSFGTGPTAQTVVIIEGSPAQPGFQTAAPTNGGARVGYTVLSLWLSQRRTEGAQALQLAIGGMDEAIAALKKSSSYAGFSARTLGAGNVAVSVTTPKQARCSHRFMRSHPKIHSPRNVDSVKNAATVSTASGALNTWPNTSFSPFQFNASCTSITRPDSTPMP